MNIEDLKDGFQDLIDGLMGYCKDLETQVAIIAAQRDELRAMLHGRAEAPAPILRITPSRATYVPPNRRKKMKKCARPDCEVEQLMNPDRKYCDTCSPLMRGVLMRDGIARRMRESQTDQRLIAQLAERGVK